MPKRRGWISQDATVTADTFASFETIRDGSVDNRPQQALLYVRGIEEVEVAFTELIKSIEGAANYLTPPLLLFAIIRWSSDMVDIKQAIANAKDFAKEVLNQEDLLLEEVSSDPEAFEITLSMPIRAGTVKYDLTNPVNLQELFRPRYSDRREFKSFRVLKRDGTVTRMTIREIA